MFALRGDRHPTSFPHSVRTALDRFRSPDHRFCQDSFCCAVRWPRMRAAVLSRLIVRGLGNFRRSGRCWPMMLERLSVVSYGHRTCACKRTNVYTHAPAPYTHGTDASTYVHPRIYCIVFQCADPLQRYLNAYLALEAVSPFPSSTR